MYIFELFYKIFHKKNTAPQKTNFEEDYIKCEHVFLPVDSTKNVLACIKCGVIKKIDNNS